MICLSLFDEGVKQVSAYPYSKKIKLCVAKQVNSQASLSASILVPPFLAFLSPRLHAWNNFEA